MESIRLWKFIIVALFFIVTIILFCFICFVCYFSSSMLHITDNSIFSSIGRFRCFVSCFFNFVTNWSCCIFHWSFCSFYSLFFPTVFAAYSTFLPAVLIPSLAFYKPSSALSLLESKSSPTFLPAASMPEPTVLIPLSTTALPASTIFSPTTPPTALF